MNSSNLIKAVTNFSFRLRDDFSQYFETQPGKGHFSESAFQQIQIQESDNQQNNPQQQSNKQQQQDDGQFKLQIDQVQQNTANTIKTYQFNSGMFAPSKMDRKIQQSIPQIQIKLQDYYGHNSKYKSNCIILNQTVYCISIGCNIILCPIKKQQKVKNKKIYQQHQFQICKLYYSKEFKYLISGSKGIKPQIIVWSFDDNKLFQQCNLNFVNRFYLPRKSQAVGLFQLINQNIVICIDSVSIHRGNSMYMFDLQAGNQYKQPIKIQGKVYDICKGQNKQIYFGTDKGIYQLKSLQQGKIQMYYDKNNKILSIQKFNDKIIIGDRQGNLQIISKQKKSIFKINVHKCCLYICKIIQQKLLLITSQIDNNIVKFHQIIQNKQKISIKTQQNEILTFNSYCTSINCYNINNIILGMRDGSIIIYDYQKKQKKFQKYSAISCTQQYNQQFFIFNKINQRLILLPAKNIVCQILPNCFSNSTSTNINIINQCISTKLQNKPKCIWFNKDKNIQVFCMQGQKQNKLKIQLYNITKMQKQPQKQILIKSEQKGKPKIVRFNQDLIVIGTKLGYIILYCLKNSLILFSEENHSTAVQDIIFQQPQIKQKQLYYIKSVAGSQLFYWQLQLFSKQPKIKKISKAAPVKNLTWNNICKYGWETRNIWEQMTHFQDINNVAIFDQKYLCVSMWNGMLRVYRYPASKNNYKQFKLFPNKFVLTVIKNKNKENILACSSKCCIMYIKFI